HPPPPAAIADTRTPSVSGPSCAPATAYTAPDSASAPPRYPPARRVRALPTESPRSQLPRPPRSPPQLSSPTAASYLRATRPHPPAAPPSSPALLRAAPVHSPSPIPTAAPAPDSTASSNTPASSRT